MDHVSSLASHFSATLLAAQLGSVLTTPDLSASVASVDAARLAASAAGAHASAQALLQVCAALRLDAALIIGGTSVLGSGNCCD